MSTANHPETDGQTERVNHSVECYLRCFISAHPQHWAKWISLCEFWYNTNWHSSLGQTPFELLYGRQPRYFGITASHSIASADTQAWLDERTLILDSIRQHLLRMQQRMEHQADKHRIEREFAVGDEVFLHLQPYIQSSIVRRANHKLSFNFFGPYKIIERVGQVAYRLALPESGRVHPVFHVSQLKPCIGSPRQVLSQLPSPDDVFQVPVRILQRRARQVGHRTVVQALIHWSGSSPGLPLKLPGKTWTPFGNSFPEHLLGGKQVSNGGGLSAARPHLAVTPLTPACRRTRKQATGGP